MRQGTLRVPILFVTVSLLAAGCGTRLSAEERALFAGRGSGERPASAATSTSPTPGVAAGPGGDAAVTAGGDTTGGATSGGATSAAGGTAAGTGPASSGGARASSEPCAAPSREVGVTQNTLTLGGVFQLSGLLPGFAQTAAYGAQAYTDYLNASGGLCGRRVEYAVLDDGFDASRNAEQTRALIGRAVSLVGSFSAADDGGATTLRQSKALEISVGTTPARQTVPNHYPLLGREKPPEAPGMALPEYKFAVQHGAKKLAIIFVNVAAGRGVAVGAGKDAVAAGMNIVLEREVSPTQFSYASTARAIADSGAEMVLCLLEINGSVQLAEELTRVKHSVKFPFYRLGYDQRFLDSAGAAANGAVNFLEFLPFEEAGSNAGLDAFLKHYGAVAPGVAPTFMAMQGWVAMEAYAQVIRSLPGPITRDALLAAAKNLRNLDGRGLFNNIDFGSRQRPGCKVVVRVVNGRYRREAPASGFYC